MDCLTTSAPFRGASEASDLPAGALLKAKGQESEFSPALVSFALSL